MKTNTRFIKSIIETAANNQAVMPWSRGATRAAFIEKRAVAAANGQKTA